MYYPKSQIIENLYTNGGEYAIKSTNKEYKGYYYQVSNHQRFTGENSNQCLKARLTSSQNKENNAPDNVKSGISSRIC